LLLAATLAACGEKKPAYVPSDLARPDAQSTDVAPEQGTELGAPEVLGERDAEPPAPDVTPLIDLGPEADVDPTPDLGLGPPDAGAPLPDAPPVIDAVDAGDANEADTADASSRADVSSSDAAFDLGAPVAYWKLDEPSGVAVADTTTRNGGTLLGGARFVPEGFGGATFANAGSVTFDGVDDYAELGVAGLPAFDKPRTVSAWFRSANPSPQTRRANLVALTNPAVPFSTQLGLDYDRVALWFWSAPGPIVAAPTVAGSGWHHVAYTFDGAGGYRLYFDGRDVGTATMVATDKAMTRARLAAWDPSDPAEMFAGNIDDVRIYDRVLSPPELAQVAEGR
jgi:predicted small lipoprotein YifL